MSTDHGREFRQQLALLLIDKAVIGGFVLLLGFLAQAGLAERDRLAAQRERAREAALSVSQVFTEIVDENRELIVKAVEDLLAVLNQSETAGRVTSTEARNRLRNIVENLENGLNQLARINPELPAKTDGFLQQVRRIRSDLVNRRRDPEVLQEDQESLSAGYTDLLVHLRTTSVLA